MEYVILFFLVFFGFRYVVFFLSLVPLHLMIRRHQRKFIESGGNKAMFIVDEPSTINLNFFKVIISSYIQGYIRFFIINVGMIPSHFIRNIIYKKILMINMEQYAIIYYGAEIRAPYNLKIGKGSIIGDKAILDARNGIEIGENVNFSSNVQIWSEQHDHRDPDFACNSDNSFKVIIGDRAWIGPNVTILPKVNIGEGAVVAAGSVVTKDVEPFSIVAGLPAKKIGERNRDLKYNFIGSPLAFY